MFERVLFLDIDGVVHITDSMRRANEGLNEFMLFDSEAVRHLRSVVEPKQAKIVISSDWRRWPDWKEAITGRLNFAGWENAGSFIIDCTPIFDDDRSRADEIRAWLEVNPTKSFVVLDDWPHHFPEPMPTLVLCDHLQGVTLAQVEAINRIWS